MRLLIMSPLIMLDEFPRNAAKRVRYSGGVPTTACIHDIAKVCQMATLSGEEVANMNRDL